MVFKLTEYEIERIFNKLNLKVKHSKHHKYSNICVNGKIVSKVYYSHGRGGIPTRSAHSIRNQFMLNLNDFISLKNCSMSRRKYYKQLEKNVGL